MKKTIFVILSILLLSACGGGSGSGGDPIVISGKPWTEQRILPYILAEYIKAETDYPVKVDEAVGETNVLQQAILDGDIDMYVEYTGTGYLAVLKKKFKPGQTPEEIYSMTKKGYEEQFDLTWLAPLGFENSYTLAMRKDQANKLNIEKASDITPHSEKLIFGGPGTFYARADGYDYMAEAYSFNFKEKVTIKPNLMYKALKDGEVDVIPAFTTDSRLKKYNLKTTVDDKNIFPPYFAAPVVRQDVLKEYPELKTVMQGLEGKISDEEMLEMNAQVDIEQKSPEDVAKQFLKDQGLIE